MKIKEFRKILDAYGADPDRWPEAVRAQARALLEQSMPARRLQEETRALDTLLDRSTLPSRERLDSAALAESITSRGPAIRQAGRNGRAISLGWPNFAVLAAAAAAGFLIGWFAIDIEPADTDAVTFSEFSDDIVIGEESLW
ncbi:MAG: hypothetical protein V3V17_06080 [Alphaproteobacteria bacterium]